MRRKNGYYYFTEWTGKNIFLRCILAPILLCLILMLGWGSLIKLANNGFSATDTAIVLVFLAIFIIIFRTLIAPRYYASMRAVRGYLSHRDLMNLLKDEKFTRFSWDGKEKNRFGDGKIYESDSWVASFSQGEVMIPKTTVIGIFLNSGDPVTSDYAEVFLLTIDGKSWPFASIEKEVLPGFLSSLSEIFLNMNEHNVFDISYCDSSYRKELKKWFQKTIPDRATYIDMIREGIDISTMPDVGKSEV